MRELAKVFVIDDFKKDTNWYGYYADFYNNKIFGDVIPYFGRDASLDTPTLFHIHIANNQELIDKWDKIKNVYDRSTETKEPENDFWLIYAYDKNDNQYLILSLVGPNAHNRDKWTPYYNTLYNDIIKPWINGLITYIEPD